MNNFGWLIPIIAIIIWVLGNLAQGRDKDERKPQGKRPQRRRRPQSKAASEIDKFLEEVNTRRQQREQQSQKDTGSPPPYAKPPSSSNKNKTAADEFQEMQSRQVPSSHMPEAKPASGSGRTQPTPSQSAINEYLITAADLAESIDLEQPLFQSELTRTSIYDSPQQAKAGRAVTPRYDNPLLSNIVNMLEDGNGLQQAVVLNEILSKPKGLR